MKLRFAMIADTANLSREGKLNIAGEFDTIYALEAPVTWPSFVIVSRFDASISEGSEHTLQIGFYDADGGEVGPKTKPAPFTFAPAGPGRPLRGQIIIGVNGLKLPAFGAYDIHILVDGRHEASIPLHVTKRQQTRPTGDVEES